MKKILALLLIAMMIFALSACGSKTTNEIENSTPEQQPEAAAIENKPGVNLVETVDEPSEGIDNETDGAEQEESEMATSEEPEDDNSAEGLVDGMRPEFKEAMDSYEAFYDEYYDFIEKYTADPTDMSLLSEYSDMMTKALDMDEKFAKWDEEEMNNEELKYYIEVSSRVAQKAIDAIA